MTQRREYLHRWAQSRPFACHVVCEVGIWARYLDVETGRWSGPWKLYRKPLGV